MVTNDIVLVNDDDIRLYPAFLHRRLQLLDHSSPIIAHNFIHELKNDLCWRCTPVKQNDSNAERWIDCRTNVEKSDIYRWIRMTRRGEYKEKIPKAFTITIMQKVSLITKEMIK